MDVPRQPAPSAPAGPVLQSDRIIPLDVLRGFAVLGILVMNIQSFSMPDAAYFNPHAYGNLQGLDYWVWLLSHLLVDMKFMAIFSMLFGAGMVLMAERMEERGRRPGPVHYRRMVILLFVGLAHAWLLWTGDILFTYAMCGLLVYLFRKRRPWTLIVLGIVALGVATTLAVLSQVFLPYWPPEQIADMSEWWAPSAATLSETLETFRGGWSQQNGLRFENALMMQTGAFLSYMSWRAGGMMLIGMGLYKKGVFHATLAKRTYWWMIVVGVAVGIPVILLGVRYMNATDWAFETGFFVGRQPNYWASVLVALGWVGVVMLACLRFQGGRLYSAFAATGQMALTNYLLQTLICTTLFYGHGFGLYGSVERTGQILIVFAIWAAMLVWSPWWLTRFRFGPFEWLWRTLTYMKLQPMRREA
ncbi:DUF418 domain-containing protein [Gemmatimonadota bacterium]